LYQKLLIYLSWEIPLAWPINDQQLNIKIENSKNQEILENMPIRADAGLTSWRKDKEPDYIRVLF